MDALLKSSSYLLRGAALMLTPGYKRYILIPIISNVILFGFIMMGLFAYAEGWMNWFDNWIPSWLSFLTFFLWIIFGVVILFLYSLSFTSITNLIAAPFNGLLAEKAWKDQTGESLPEESLPSIIIRTVGREIRKLAYFVGWGLLVAIGLFMLSFIPVANLVIPLLGLMWTLWVLSNQYVDYCADNLQVSFPDMKSKLRENYWSTQLFGLTIFIATLIPIVNIFVMSAAVVGGVLYWKDIKFEEQMS